VHSKHGRGATPPCHPCQMKRLSERILSGIRIERFCRYQHIAAKHSTVRSPARSGHHATATLINDGEALLLTPQIMAEFWNVATRPRANNGFGLSHEKAREEILNIESFFSVLDESREVYNEWKRLIVAYSVTGVKTHDARLVAAMNVYGISRILTFNAEDFTRYDFHASEYRCLVEMLEQAAEHSNLPYESGWREELVHASDSFRTSYCPCA